MKSWLLVIPRNKYLQLFCTFSNIKTTIRRPKRNETFQIFFSINYTVIRRSAHDDVMTEREMWSKFDPKASNR